jgi:hypothetical protein
MKQEVANWTDADIIRAREGRYHGWNDLATEGALKWSLTKHPHPLNEIHQKCSWCAIERRCLDAVHCATRAKGEPWWEQFVFDMSREAHAIVDEIGGFSWSDVRVSLPDGRWWVARTFDNPERSLKERGEPQWTVGPLKRPEGAAS